MSQRPPGHAPWAACYHNGACADCRASSREGDLQLQSKIAVAGMFAFMLSRWCIVREFAAELELSASKLTAMQAALEQANAALHQQARARCLLAWV